MNDCSPLGLSFLTRKLVGWPGLCPGPPLLLGHVGHLALKSTVVIPMTNMFLGWTSSASQDGVGFSVGSHQSGCTLQLCDGPQHGQLPTPNMTAQPQEMQAPRNFTAGSDT